MALWLLCGVLVLGVVNCQPPVDDRVANILDSSLYKGDKIDEFLNLCRFPNDQQSEDFESYFSRTMAENPTDGRCPSLDIGIHSGMSSEDEKEHVKKRFEDLRRAQQLVREYHHVLVTRDYYAVAGILIFVLIGGIYLVMVGHYDWRAIFDEYHADGSHGVPCWQYLRMRYVAAKVRSNTKNKTLLVPIFENGVEVEEPGDRKTRKTLN